MLHFRLGLEKLGVFQASDHTALVIKVFWRSVAPFLLAHSYRAELT